MQSPNHPMRNETTIDARPAHAIIPSIRTIKQLHTGDAAAWQVWSSYVNGLRTRVNTFHHRNLAGE